MPCGDELTPDHLDHLTDSTGLVQDALYNVTQHESPYTTDDNTRALRLRYLLLRLPRHQSPIEDRHSSAPPVQ